MTLYHVLKPVPDQPWPLMDVARTRRQERDLACRLPPHALLERAGRSVYRLSAALAPCAQRVWVACGAGHNGLDGLIAATHWAQHFGRVGRGTVTVTAWPPHPSTATDAHHWRERAHAAGVRFEATAPSDPDIAIDALLGIGLNQPVRGDAATCIQQLQSANCPVLCIDVPSGLDADTGSWRADTKLQASAQRHTLSLLTLKPGLFTHMGRAAAGDIWFDDLDTTQPGAHGPDDATAWLYAPNRTLPVGPPPHAHKGLRGDLIVIGGQEDVATGSMRGAAILAARAGLKAGAGRVFVGLLTTSPGLATIGHDPLQPELMFKPPAALVESSSSSAVMVCGCGGGDSITRWLPDIMTREGPLVLDADALNAIAASESLQLALQQRQTQGRLSVLTPHPLEAARLLGMSTAAIQSNRLEAAKRLANHYRCVVVLKGSGTVVAKPGATPSINPTGNGWLATGGTGDVLAGLIGAGLCDGQIEPMHAVQRAVFQHGLTASERPARQGSFVASDVVARWQP